MQTETGNLAELAQTLFQESGDALFLFDPDTEQLLDINPMAERLTGFPRQALLCLPVGALFRPEVSGGLQRLRQACRQRGRFRSQEGFLLRHDGGTWVPVTLTVTPVEAERRTRGLITARDVSERREAQALLRQREAGYRTLIENLEQYIFLKDEQFRFVAVNPPFCRAVGRSEEEIVGRTDFDFYPPELAVKFRTDDQQVLLAGRRIETEELSLLGGQSRTVRVVKTPVCDGQGRPVGVLGIFWDVTDQRSLEAQLRQAQKMEAVGQLAGGVAHDFNNLLTAIVGNLALLSRTSLGLAGLEMLQAAEQAAGRAANLTAQLLSFARRTLLRPEPARLNDTITEVVSLLQRTIDPRIALEVQRADDLWFVLADPGQMNQVLMNLCLNARDAMPQGGRLTIQTENVVLQPEKIRLQLEARSGEFVRLRVRDTGQGIAPEIQPHLFEPFFTTKEHGKGTGLGLATVFGIVKQHEGWIECDSQLGQGTCFTVHLPRHHPSEEVAAPAIPAHPEPIATRGTETILFVDDELVLRNLGRAILERCGYCVLVADDGLEALELFRREGDRIDLVILDLTMPRLSGRDAFRQLRALDPRVPVLFASGYSLEQLDPDEQQQVSGFVAKPYRPGDLTALVREILDSKTRLRD